MARSPLHCRGSRPASRLVVISLAASSRTPARAASGQLAPQAPAFPSANAAPAIQAPIGAAEQQIEAYPLAAESRDVLMSWQKYALARTDMRVAIDERTSQVLVWAPAALHGEIRQQLAAKGAAAQVQAQPPAAELAAPAGPVF